MTPRALRARRSDTGAATPKRRRGRPRAPGASSERPPRRDRAGCAGRPRRLPSRLLLSAEDGLLDLSAGVVEQRLHLGLALAEAAEHVGGDDLRVGRVGAPDADAHPHEALPAELALD